MEPAITMAQIVTLAVGIIVTLIGAIWGVAWAMGRMVVRNMELSFTDLKAELALTKMELKGIQKELKILNDSRIRQEEHVIQLTSRVDHVEQRVKDLEENFQKVRDHHLKNHPKDDL